MVLAKLHDPAEYPVVQLQALDLLCKLSDYTPVRDAFMEPGNIRLLVRKYGGHDKLKIRRKTLELVALLASPADPSALQQLLLLRVKKEEALTGTAASAGQDAVGGASPSWRRPAGMGSPQSARARTGAGSSDISASANMITNGAVVPSSSPMPLRMALAKHGVLHLLMANRDSSDEFCRRYVVIQ